MYLKGYIIHHQEFFLSYFENLLNYCHFQEEKKRNLALL